MWLYGQHMLWFRITVENLCIIHVTNQMQVDTTIVYLHRNLTVE